MKKLVTLTGLGLLFTMASCGRPFVIGEGSGGGGAAPSGSGAGEGGPLGGSTGAAGNDGGGGSFVPACEAGVAGACPAGEYCDVGENACRPCADLERLRFYEKVSPLAIAPTTAGTTAFYPRVSPDDGSLYFTYVDKKEPIPRRRIASALRKHEVPGWAWSPWLFVPHPVGSLGQDSGPLYLSDGWMLDQLVDPNKVDVSKPVILFDSNRSSSMTQQIFAANVEGAAAVPVSLPVGTHDVDVAAAPFASPPRFYWLSDAGGAGQRLVTATAMSPAAEVKITLDNGCATSLVEAPWVTPDGKLLLFSAAYPAPATCAPVAAGVRHLFAAHMNDAGEQVQGEQAKPLFPGDMLSYDSTPALTPDLCMLLFSRFDATANGRLYGVLRE